MFHRRVVTLASVLSVLAACGPTGLDGPAESELTREAKEIVGGTVNNGDPEVFMLRMVYNNGLGSACSATLIGRSTLLTAAHCVDPLMGKAFGMQIWAINRTDAMEAPQSEWIELVETKMHPGWNPTQPDAANDIAMARLARSPGITPKPWNTSSVDGFTGRSLRAVGYGITGNADEDSSGTKRHVSLVFDQINSTHIFLGDRSRKGVCHGDSGGPTFHTFSDGIERVVGVHSYDASGNCLYGGDIRVDAYQSFVQQWLDTWEPATCAEDGQCKATGCTPVDVDCYCVADGVCSADCRDLSTDPDCPANCGADGVCAQDTCPVLDEDCVPEGETCTSEDQCQSRICMSDPMHPESYCSRACATTAQCPAGMECVPGAQVCQFIQAAEVGKGEACTPGESRCAQGTVCTGTTRATARCEVPCTTGTECPAENTCAVGHDGNTNYCRSPEATAVLLPTGNHMTGKTGSCAAAGGVPLSALVLALAGVLSRRTGSERSSSQAPLSADGVPGR